MRSPVPTIGKLCQRWFRLCDWGQPFLWGFSGVVKVLRFVVRCSQPTIVASGNLSILGVYCIKKALFGQKKTTLWILWESLAPKILTTINFVEPAPTIVLSPSWVRPLRGYICCGKCKIWIERPYKDHPVCILFRSWPKTLRFLLVQPRHHILAQVEKMACISGYK
jgi:hypothetical protein